MTLSVDMGSGQIATMSENCNNLRLAKFIAILALSAEADQREVNSARMLSVLGATVRQPRPFFHRLLQYADERPFLRGVIDGTSRTTGPWMLGAKWHGEVQVLRNGAAVTLAELTVHHGSHGADASVQGQFPKIISGAGIISLTDGDRSFAKGQLAAAERSYSSTEITGPVLEAIGSARLLQTHIRTESHARALAESKRLRRLSNDIQNSVLWRHLRLRGDLGRAWHTYAKDHQYALAHQRLAEIREACSDFSDLHIDWLGLYGITERRLALGLFDAGQRGGPYRDHASRAIGALSDALSLALACGTSYQIQKASANLGNVVALFATGEHAELLNLPYTSDMILSLLGASEHVCKTMGIGRDDIYNPVYILSAARKFGIPATDSEKWIRAGLSDVAHAKSLAGYGDEEYRLQRDRVGPEQKSFLAYEICCASIEEDNPDLFRRYAKELDSTWLQIPDGNSSVAEYQMARLQRRLAARTSPIWRAIKEDFRGQ